MQKQLITILLALTLCIPLQAQPSSGLVFLKDARDSSKIRTLYITQSVTQIDFNQLENKYDLDSIAVSPDNNNYTSDHGVLYNKDKTILIRYPPQKEGMLYIFSSVKEIEKNAFYYCVYLDSIAVSPDNPNYSSADGVLYNKQKTTLLFCRGWHKKVIIPKSVKTIDIHKLGGAVVVLHDSVKIIIEDNDYLIGDQEFVIPPTNPYHLYQDGVLYAKKNGNKEVRIIKFPYTIKSDIHIAPILERFKFWGNWVSVVRRRDDKGNRYSESMCDIKLVGGKHTLYLPSTMKVIEDKSFMNFPMDIKIPKVNSIREIGKDAFSSASIDSITLDSVQHISKFSFQYSSLKFVEINSDSLKIIEQGFFLGCDNLTTIKLSESVTQISTLAFQSCKLTSVTIPQSVSKIEPDAFGFCTDSLKEVIVKRREPLNESGFRGKTINCTLRVPKGTRKAYKKSSVWKGFKEIVEVE